VFVGLDVSAGHAARHSDSDQVVLFVLFLRARCFQGGFMMSQVQLFPLDWNMTDFHQRLRHLRTARKLTQTRVAELLGISPRVYTRWENGGATPLFGTVVRIADILGVSLDELAGRSDSAGEPQIRNPELHRLYKKVDLLSDEDQKALLVVLDSLVKRSRVRRVMAE
jgi:transcriptional regulator with XRE-family HTH domain